MRRSDLTPTWFFGEPPWPLRMLLIYIRGDAIVLVPFTILLLIVGFFSLRWMALLAALLFSFRALGEMIYWLLQQFGGKTYRPYDFGFRKLDNTALYVLYQLISLVMLVLGTAAVCYLLLTWR